MEAEFPNRDRFDEVTAKLLRLLYEIFPRRLDIDSGLFVARQLDLGEGPEIEIPSDIVGLVADTLEWLAEEGFIRYEEHHETMGDESSIFSRVTLTLSGFALLDTPMPIGTPDTGPHSLIRLLKDGLESGAKDVIRDAIRTVFAAATSAFTSRLWGGP